MRAFENRRFLVTTEGKAAAQLHSLTDETSEAHNLSATGLKHLADMAVRLSSIQTS